MNKCKKFVVSNLLLEDGTLASTKFDCVREENHEGQHMTYDKTLWYYGEESK